MRIFLRFLKKALQKLLKDYVLFVSFIWINNSARVASQRASFLELRIFDALFFYAF